MAAGSIAKTWKSLRRRDEGDSEYAAAIFIYVLDLLDQLEVVPSASSKLDDDELIDEDHALIFVERYREHAHQLGIPFSKRPLVESLPYQGE